MIIIIIIMNVFVFNLISLCIPVGAVHPERAGYVPLRHDVTGRKCSLLLTALQHGVFLASELNGILTVLKL